MPPETTSVLERQDRLFEPLFENYILDEDQDYNEPYDKRSVPPQSFKVYDAVPNGHLQ